MRGNVKSLLKGWGILLVGSLLLGWALFGLPWVTTQPSIFPWFYAIRLASYYTLIASAIVLTFYGAYLCIFPGGLSQRAANHRWTLIISIIMIFVGLVWTQFWVVFVHDLASYLTGLPLHLLPIDLSWMFQYLDYNEMQMMYNFVGSFVSTGVLQVLIGAYPIALRIYDRFKK
jgi:hypothetical protein